MTDYHKKLIATQRQRQKLIETEKTLIDKRKIEIANLVEQFHLLTIDDKILSNFFAHFKEYCHEHPPKTSHDPGNHLSSQSEICEAENART
ncbi:MAG TPA: hypothetical protein VGU44_05215 [Gammaproteobacteria bacterium]|nr:hypothetical protein [Gammaproteobacteria bacterium]